MGGTSAALKGLRSAHPGDREFDAVIDAFRMAPTDSAIAELAEVLGTSGRTLLAPAPRTTDVASTGAPGSLTTILSPVYCRAIGWEIRKITVPGRPAGSVDVLSVLRGYRADLNHGEALHALESAGFVQLLAGERWAPHDARLFSRRQVRGAQEVPELVMASILAKKIAAGLSDFTLDVRVGAHGNFGATTVTAEENSSRLVVVASLLGITARCCVSAADDVAQPYIGRGEALVALDLVLSDADPGAWLGGHARHCASLAELATGSTAAISRALARSVLERHLTAQGADEGAWEEALTRIRGEAVVDLCADSDGRMSVDVAAVRDAITSVQRATATRVSPFPDPMGVVLARRPGEQVTRGDLLARVRAPGMAAKSLTASARP